MEMHQIRYFLSASETLNFSHAAKSCHVSQPSLTRAIKKLEAELDGELFRRERSRTHLTELGRSMLPLLRQSYESALAAKAQAEHYRRADVAPLRLGLSSTISIEFLLPVLDELSFTLPGLELHLDRGEAEEVLADLEKGAIELGITAVAGNVWERIDRYLLFAESFVVIAPSDHPLAGKRTVPIEALKDQHLLPRPYCEHHQSLELALQDRNIAFKSSHKPANESDLMALVSRGHGIGIIPRSTAVPCDVVAVPFKDIELSRNVTLLSVSGRQHSAAAAGLLKLLRAADWSANEGIGNHTSFWGTASKLSAGLSIERPAGQPATHTMTPHVVAQRERTTQAIETHQ